MTTRPALRTTMRRTSDWHRPLLWLAAGMAITGVVSTVGYLVDDRVVGGVPVWSKPLQFSISFAGYALTLAWLIAELERPRVRRLVHRAGTAIAVATALEMSAIVLQVVRGRQSHFNFATPLDAAVFAAMGVFVMIIFVATVLVGLALLRQSAVVDRATARAVRLGLGISVLGMSIGFLMVTPRSSQGPDAVIRGAHSVGAADGGPGLPLVGWSTTAGDLRVPHFIGLHALQVLPLLAIALALVPRLGERARVRLLGVGAAGYLGVFALSLGQALRGQSVIAPDVWTLLGLAAVVMAVVVAGGAIVRADRSSRPTGTGRVPVPV